MERIALNFTRTNLDNYRSLSCILIYYNGTITITITYSVNKRNARVISYNENIEERKILTVIEEYDNYNIIHYIVP